MTQPNSSPIAATLAWLSREDDPDPLQNLVPLRRHLRGLLAASLSPAQGRELATTLLPRLAATENALLGLLRNASLPLAPPLRTLTQVMGQVHELQTQVSPSREASLLRQMLIGFLSGVRLPAGFWMRVRDAMKMETDAATGLPGAMLALAAAQPESFAPPELIFLGKLIHDQGDKVRVQRHRPDQDGDWYWLDCAQDQLPVALRRRPPPREGDLIYFHCVDLGEYFASRLVHLEAGIPVRQLDLPAEEDQAVCISALRRALMHWTKPPTRTQIRRRSNRRVQVCTRLGEIWDLLRDGATGLNHCSDWLVLNENPSGYALMHLSGETGGLVAGSVLGLRPTPATPWSIWLVRWVRTENADNLEVGLELLAPGAVAVRIATNNATAEPVAALLLTSPPRLDQREALLIPRAPASRRDFTLLTESRGRIKLTACRPGSLRHQTSSVEIFEFERLPLT
ncbi:hypothetical protein [Denitratisoma oestradiolicum]|uniref:Molecular chaperone n=1 Tax=Denitratisoma oestradiolicum TaxID=311182 RepID=A0A6S6YQ95_9PROT|nr:hypothetical protein [Denitratisoma oestradiolicum]TWO78986.1 hypothetical protein CBW56_17080 [Denitratisoma oestradiolicum]CAB1369942.1 conserved protein of unknown function [Denitratisoma oestradiolicum]